MRGKAFILFGLEFKILLKDRQALGLLFLMPLAFIFFLTMALKDVYLMKVGTKLKIDFIAPADCLSEGGLCGGLTGELRRFGYTVETRDTQEPHSKASMKLVLPADVDRTVEALKNGLKLEPDQQVRLIFDPGLDQSLRALVQSHFMLALQAVLIERLTQELQASETQTRAKLAHMGRFEGLVVEQADGGFILPNPIQQTVPAWALFGMFFIVIPIANSMIRDRRLGIFKRLLSFPVNRRQLLAGKILPFFVINVIQFFMMLAVGLWILPRLTGLNLSMEFNWAHLAVVTLVAASASTSYGLLVSCVTRTPEQASAFGALSVLILAVLGGIMVPRFVMPAFMQAASYFSPLYWGLEAYHDVLVRNADFGALVPKLAVLAGFALTCASVAVIRFQWNEVE